MQAFEFSELKEVDKAFFKNAIYQSDKNKNTFFSKILLVPMSYIKFFENVENIENNGKRVLVLSSEPTENSLRTAPIDPLYVLSASSY